MSDRSLSLVYDAIDEVNALGEDDLQIAKSPDTLLFSDRDGVDDGEGNPNTQWVFARSCS